MSENLWEGLLRENALRAKLPNSSVVFFGEPESGKTAVLKTFCEADEERAAFSHANTEILSYDFFVASDSRDVYETDVTAPRVSVWSLNNQAFLDCLDVALNEATIPQMMFMIGVDLSKPETCILHAKKWLRVYEQTVATCMSQLSDNQRNTLLEKNDAAVRRSGQAKQNAEGNASPAHQGVKWKNLGVPLVIVGCKSDSQQKTDQDSLAVARSVLAQLRCLALHYGGAVVYTSANEGTNCEALHKYLLHRLYPQAFPAPPATPQEGVRDAFIPAGSDAVEIIAAAGGIDPNAYISSFENEPPPVVEKPAAQTEVAEDDVLETEQTFLAHAQQFLDQSMISISSASRDTLSGSGATSGAAATAAAAPDAGEPSRPTMPKQTEEVNSEVVRDFFQSLLNTPAAGSSKPRQSSKRK